MPRIRLATADDAKAIAELWGKLGEHFPPAGKRWALSDEATEAWRRHLVAHYIGEDDGLALVAELDGEVAGYVTAELRMKPPVFRHPLVLHVDTIAVDPDEQRHGFGRALLEAALAWGRDRGAVSAEIATSWWNVPARAAWRRFGFEEAMLVMSRDL